MKLYFAGNVTTSEHEIALVTEGGAHWRLLSFADVDSWAKDAFNYWTGPSAPARFFLDSGAFGAFTRGIQIDIHRYCDYIKQVEDRIHPYACLDVIGDWRGSARNYDIMRHKGLEPLPTFHMTDHFNETELRRLLQTADYLALGGVVGASRDTMQPWLDRCWRVIRDYWPKKTHVFGVMAQWALERYPFYSADSSSAIVGAGMGRVTQWDDARITAVPWVDYGRKYYDGSVMDRVSHLSARGGVGSAHKGRAYINIRTQLQLQDHITELWRMRGIEWEDVHV